ncbi:MAG: hypothetical protein JJU45_15315 [Acidimicrobiia bacterium]|nr:hypothetical protein [Acidimicrobiia bacterium]
MRVLVVSDELHADRGVAQQLEGAGHEIVRCHDADAPAFPCAGMPGGSGCPIDGGRVDVALNVRQLSEPPTVAEDGVRCALRNHVPLVVAGTAGQAPWAGMATVVEPDTERLAAAVEEAEMAPLRRHSEAASRELRVAMERLGVEQAGGEVVVRRRDGGLQAQLRPVSVLTPRQAHAVGVRVAAALRAVDDQSIGVDVFLEQPATV